MTVSALLAQHGITVAQARAWIISNLNNLSTILSTAKQFGVTNDMLAEIYGGVSGNDVRSFFTSNGLSSTNLDIPAIKLVSSNSNGVAISTYSSEPSISADGRYVSFSYGFSEIFLKDTLTGSLQLISSSSNGTIGDNNSYISSISADGRYVAFSSAALNLVSVDAMSGYDIFLKDTLTGNTQLISSSSSGVFGNGTSDAPSISADGRYVVFSSSASNLVSGDTNGRYDIFLKDTLTGNIQLISSSSSGVIGDRGGSAPSISADGRYVVFESRSSNFVSGDTNDVDDIFLKDTFTGGIKLISSSSNGAIGNRESSAPSISADGRYVVFESESSNLVSGDTNGRSDIFLKDTLTGNIQLISSSSSGVIGREPSSNPSISADGKYITFESESSNLVSGDTNSTSDIFIVGNPLIDYAW